MRVALQPASRQNADVNQHYLDTIDKPVRFDDHIDLLSPADAKALRQRFPQGAAQMWGITPGAGGINVSQVRKLQLGDFVMFYGRPHERGSRGREGRLYLAGTIAYLFHNERLADKLWGRDHKSQTWEYMYALDACRTTEIPIREVQAILGWSDKAVVQGVRVYEGDKASALTALANLDPSDLIGNKEPADIRELREAIKDFPGDPDGRRLAAYRREQAQLKRRLRDIGGKSCALCGRELPPQFLVAAHIKKRSECTDAEKLDFDNVAMLACVLGCDSLYEHGYITVQPGGMIQVSPQVALAPAVAAHCDALLIGSRTSWWTPEREHYFAWHRGHTFRRPV